MVVEHENKLNPLEEEKEQLRSEMVQKTLYPEQKTLLTIKHCSLYTISSFVLGRSAA